MALPRQDPQMHRRSFLDFARYAALAAVIPTDWRVRHRPAFRADPFSLGVASGDPTPDSVMLWTRLAPEPLVPGYGMDAVRTAVRWELAEDDAFGRVVQQGRATAAPELGHSVHVDATGLTPGREYFYRFMAGDAVSAVGRTRTTPAADALEPLHLGVAGCQSYEAGYFTAFDHMARERFDVIAHTGDYIYEYSGRDGGVRKHATIEIQSLEDYRIRYAQYKSDAMLQAAHASCPWLVTWDDHEVDNNYAGEIGENGMESAEQMRARRAMAYQAWWENQPVRVPRVRSWADLTIHRSTAWGNLARLWTLDTRQYRSDQPCGDGNKIVPCGEWANADRNMLGDAQESWLTAGLGASSARWQVLAQQVMVAPFDFRAGPEEQVSMDQWSGYPVARDRLLGTIAERAPNRTVVLTGDIHSAWVNELRSDFRRPDAPVVAAEFVGTSIASGGDGADRSGGVTEASMSENPHLKWQNARRGYLSCRVTAGAWHTDYRVVPFVTRPGAPIETASQWRVDHGVAGIRPV
jgi:alkaline phosphatase D